MISMDFLTKSVDGLEFINFQNTDFYNKLSEVIKENITIIEGRSVLSDTCGDRLGEVIALYTGFTNIKFKFLEEGSLWIDTGYFAPGHILNNAGIDSLLKPSETSLYRWFTANKEKVFKGGIDYSTGRVSGSFCTIPVELGINCNIEDYFPADKLTKWKVGPEGALAGGIVHEVGHIFGSCVALLTTVTDNFVAFAGLNAFKEAKLKEDRVVVLKDVATLLAMKPAKSDELLEFAKTDTEETFMLYFTKLTVQRNNQRALSVGVTNMTSEVLADMYAIRMGCSKGIVAAIGTLTDRGVIEVFTGNMLVGVCGAIMSAYLAYLPAMMAGAAAAIPVAAIVGFSLGFTISYFSWGYSGVYNADHRRMEDAMRQLIAKFKDNKSMSSKDKADLIDSVNQLLVVIKKMAPWYEGTGLYRMFGWVFSGSDFKLKEIEHYTQALNNHEISLLSEQFKGV